MSKTNTKKKKVKRLPQFSSDSKIAKEAIEFLQQNIRIDTTNPPGNEMVLAKIIQKKFETEQNSLTQTKIIETKPGRGNLIVDIQGSDPMEISTFFWRISSNGT